MEEREEACEKTDKEPQAGGGVVAPPGNESEDYHQRNDNGEGERGRNKEQMKRDSKKENRERKQEREE